MTNHPVTEIIEALGRLRLEKPLVHHLTNYVTVNDCANCVLAIGGSPIMADETDEVEEIVSIASSLVINIGTSNRRTLESMVTAGRKARKLGIPSVLDPVGAGASLYRTQAAERLIRETGPAVIRGNSSEIRCIAGLSAATRGVDAAAEDTAQGLKADIETVSSLAKHLKCVIALTGAVDIVSDGDRTAWIENGHPRLSAVTGTGCMCTSLIGAFCGSTSDPFIAAVGGILCTGVAGELAAEETAARGTGSFHSALIDQISLMDGDTITEKARLHVS